MKPVAMIPTGEATIGPFFPPRYVDAGANDLTQLEGRQANGEVIEIQGRVTQEDGHQAWSSPIYLIAAA